MTSGTLKQSHVRTKRAAFVDASMSSAPARTAGCWATIADAPAAEPREADDDVLRPARLDLEELAVVDDAVDDVVHVVGLGRVVGHDRVERRVAPVGRIAGLATRRVAEVVLRQVAEDPPGRRQRLRLVAAPRGARRR